MTTLNTEKILAACNTLNERGEKVTQAAVREELGGGSFTTIGTVVRQWRDNAALQAQAKRKSPIPEAVQIQMNDWNSELWACAVVAANEQLDNQRQALEAQAKALQLRAGEDAEVIKLLEAEIETNNHANADLMAKNETLNADLAQATAEINQLTTALAVANTELDNNKALLNRATEGEQEARQQVERLIEKIGQKND